jgi:hypothetical protein
MSPSGVTNTNASTAFQARVPTRTREGWVAFTRWLISLTRFAAVLESIATAIRSFEFARQAQKALWGADP